MSSRKHLYVDYLAWLDSISIRRILIFFIAGLIILELFWRGFAPNYARTAVSSMHGIRSIIQQLNNTNKDKIIGVGDSTLLGGGVYDHKQTFMGYMSAALSVKSSGIELFNLAVPRGDTVTSALILDSIKTLNIKNIDRVIVEVLPSKFFAHNGEPTSKYESLSAVVELQNFIPFLQPKSFDLEVPSLPFTRKAEVYAQWWLGNFSMLYRHRDYLRTEVVGNYPVYWLIGNLLPRTLLNKFFPEKSKGTNRLAARADDFNFNPKENNNNSKKNSENFLKFTSKGQGDYLKSTLKIAKDISAKPPIILSFPIHYEYDNPNTFERANTLEALSELQNYLDLVAKETGSELIFLDSKMFQSSNLWTRTRAHFNSSGHLKIWESVKNDFLKII